MPDPQDAQSLPETSRHPGWQGILDADEQILWQGQPDRRIRIELDNLRNIMPGLFAVCFSLIWMYLAAQASIVFAMFGLIFLFAGLRQLFGQLLWKAFLRSRSWYTLTDRRVIIATDVPSKGRRLVSYPLDRNTLVEFVAGDPPSILFGPEGGRRFERPGFRHIADAETVMPLIRRVQQSGPPPVDEAGA